MILLRARLRQDRARSMARMNVKALGFSRESVILPWMPRSFNPQAANDFMLMLLRGRLSISEIEQHLLTPLDRLSLEKLHHAALKEQPYIRRRAQAIIFRGCGISVAAIMRVLMLGRNTIKRYLRMYNESGVGGLLSPTKRRKTKKENDPLYREQILAAIHAPPSQYGFNRTSWTIQLLKTALKQKGHIIGKNNLSRAIKASGYKMWKAKEVLTSNDPTYKEKLEAITRILSNLGPKERFFSIDEFGPFAVKERGGRRFVRHDEFPTVPQFQKSKGSLIVTAALELSTNQVTHFYSTRKNSTEIIKMARMLVDQYAGCDTIYLSWDHASWHSSKELLAEISAMNNAEKRNSTAPIIKIAPLPARSQFLNVIESVFSGMAAAIIENSNYGSIADASNAIDRYFSERNEYYWAHPKRAGNKIWGKERVPAIFKEGQNCKDPAWR